MRSLTTSLVIVVLIATVGLGWLIDQFYDDYTNSADSKTIDAVTALEQIGSDLALTLNNLSMKDDFVNNWKTQNDYTLELISVDDFPIPKSLLDEIKQGKPLLLETNLQLAIHFYLQSTNELLVLKSPLLKVQTSDSSLQYFLTFLFYALLLFLFFIWVYPLLKQLKRLRKAAQCFGEGKLEQRIDTTSVSYIRDIEIEFNRMAQRIDNLLSDVKLLSSAVSHDLRTPLARIRFGVDTLQEETDPELQQQYMIKISNNVDEMTSLVETLLTYSRLDQTMLELQKNNIDIVKLIKSCITNASSSTVDIELSTSDDGYFVMVNKPTMIMLFTNLIQNAIHYGNGKILIDIHSSQGKIVINISDDGEGVPSHLRETIFKPFCRGDENSISKNAKGHGIGLAIVKRIIEWHHGNIAVAEQSKLAGATFTLSLIESSNNSSSS